MQVVKRINTGAVLCVDKEGNQLVALGKGLGFRELGQELSIDEVSRTFYDIDPMYLSMFSEIPLDVLELSSEVVDASMGLLSYELSPNIAFILADHIAFAIKRARERIAVQMPLAYDVKQQYPVEYQIGIWTVKRVNQQYDLYLPPQEAVGIALAFVNNADVPKDPAPKDEERVLAVILEEATRLVERDLDVQVDRDSVNYARFATHIQYLFARVLAGDAIESVNESMYATVCTEYPGVAVCSDHISDIFLEHLGRSLSDEEKLYLMLHVNRIAVKAAT